MDGPTPGPGDKSPTSSMGEATSSPPDMVPKDTVAVRARKRGLGLGLEGLGAGRQERVAAVKAYVACESAYVGGEVGQGVKVMCRVVLESCRVQSKNKKTHVVDGGMTMRRLRGLRGWSEMVGQVE